MPRTPQQVAFLDLEDNIANGPVLVGGAERVIEKILRYHAAFGNEVLSISVDGLTEAEQLEQVEFFASEVAPVLRREVPSRVWSHQTQPSDHAQLVSAKELI